MTNMKNYTTDTIFAVTALIAMVAIAVLYGTTAPEIANLIMIWFVGSLVSFAITLTALYFVVKHAVIAAIKAAHPAREEWSR
jgi:uncharacterized Tic20 family protein